MTRPIDSQHAFGYFGLMIATLPAFTIALKGLASGGVNSAGIAILFISAGLGAGLAGLVLGQGFVPGALSSLSKFALPFRVVLWILLGLVWGAISGAAGGLVIFLAGAIVTGIVGGMVGAVAVPIMVALHSIMKIGDDIEARHYLPIAFGITLSVCAVILGL